MHDRAAERHWDWLGHTGAEELHVDWSALRALQLVGNLLCGPAACVERVDLDDLIDDLTREALDKGASREELIDALRKKARELAEELASLG